MITVSSSNPQRSLARCDVLELRPELRTMRSEGRLLARLAWWRSRYLHPQELLADEDIVAMLKRMRSLNAEKGPIL